MCSKIKTILIEDESVLRDMLVRLLSEAEEFEVVGSWKDAESALENVDGIHPDVAVIDFRLPGMDGIELTRKLIERWPNIKALILTADRREALIRKAFNAGATGFLYKEARFDELLFAIKAVGRGSTYLYTELVKDIIILREGFMEEEEELTPECISILRLAAKGCANKEISIRLRMTGDTVKYKLAHIMKVLKAKDRTNAVFKALKLGLIDLKD